MTGTQTKEAKAKKQAKKAVAREARRAAKETVRSMEIRQTRNAAARKIINNAVISPDNKYRINWFLIELLDPSRWEEALARGLRGIPDFYSHRNHIFCTRTIVQLGPSDFGADGKCNIICHPTLDDHLGHNNPSTTRVSYSAGIGVVVGTGLGFREHNVTGSGYTNVANPTSQQSGLVNGGRWNIYLPSMLQCASSAGANGACRRLYPIKNSGTVIDDNFGNYQYKVTPAADNQVNVLVWFGSKVTGNVTLEVVTDLATRTTTFAASADLSASISLTLDAADSEVRAINVLNSTGGTIYTDQIKTYVNLHPTVSYANLIFEQAQNMARIKEDFTAVRPVCGYLWVKYRGDLTKSGNIAGALIDSASTPTLARATEYDDVAGLLHAYEGNAVEGTYGIWCPMNSADTNFTPVEDARPLAPYLITCLDVDDVAAQNFRVEAYFVWEGLTQLQMYSPEPGSVDIRMMNDAFEKLASFPKVMANDSHLSTIARFLSNGFKKGAAVMKEFASTPQGKQSLMSAANFLLSQAKNYGPVVANAARIALQAAASV